MTTRTINQQELTISESIRYYSDRDEDCFFSWLGSVPFDYRRGRFIAWNGNRVRNIKFCTNERMMRRLP